MDRLLPRRLLPTALPMPLALYITRHITRHAFWAVLVIALAVRALYLSQLASSPLYDYPVVDGKTYVLQAQSLAQGNWLGQGHEPFWQPPLYPYLLGLVKTAFPDAFFVAVHWLQALIGALTCALTYVLGRRLFGAPIGLAAGLAAACYGTLIFFDGEILPAGLAALLDISGLLLLHWTVHNQTIEKKAVQKRRPWAFLASGLIFGLAALAVPTVLCFVPLAAGWVYWKIRSPLAAAALLAGTALAIAPVTWRNYTVGGDWVLISFNSGINFYIGNNPDYEQTRRTRPGWEWDDLVRQPVDAGLERPSQRSAYFWRKSWDYIRAQPLDYLGLLARKSLQLANGDEIGRNQDIYYWRQYSPLLAAALWKKGLAFPFGLVAPLALLGLLLALRRRGLDLATLFVLSYSLGIVAFFPTARYRVPMLPVLLVFAAYAAAWLVDASRRRDAKKLGPALALLATGAVAANIGAGPMNMQGDAEIHYNLGQAYAHKRQAPAARQAYARAVAQDSTYWQAWVNLGSMAAVQGDMAEAAAIFRRVARARPDQPEVWVNLAHAYIPLQRYADAARAYEQALDADPHQPRVYAEWMQLHFSRGDTAQARQVLDRALRQYPRDQEKLHGLFQSLQRRFGAR